MKFFRLVVLIQVMVVTVLADTRCQTPGGQSGRCVRFSHCPFYKDLRRETHNIMYLQKFDCGYFRVCCPELGSAPDCGRITFLNHIVGGTDTEPNEFPWTVLLVVDRNGVPWASGGGSLISDRYVISAAHYFKWIRSSNWQLKAVRLGEWDTTTLLDCKEEDTGEQTCNQFPHKDVPVEKVILHELYDDSSLDGEHDIALVKLTEAVPSSDAIAPICVPTAKMIETMRVDAQWFTVTGWGTTDSSSPFFRPRKQKVTLLGHPMEQCNEVYKEQHRFTHNQLCVGGAAGQGTCHGDSGGPLMVIADDRWYLAGIVCIGPTDCGKAAAPGIFTRMDSYLDWVAGKIELDAHKDRLKSIQESEENENSERSIE